MTSPVAVDAQPLIAAINAAVTESGIAYAEGKKPAVTGTKPYIVGFFDPGALASRSMVNRDGLTVVGTFHCSGRTPESARVAVRKLRAALLGLNGDVVDGRAIHVPVTDFVPPPMQREDVGELSLYVVIDEWRFRTSPA